MGGSALDLQEGGAAISPQGGAASGESAGQAGVPRHGDYRQNTTGDLEIFSVVDGQGSWVSPRERADMYSRQENYTRGKTAVARDREALAQDRAEFERRMAGAYGNAGGGFGYGAQPPVPYEQPRNPATGAPAGRSPIDYDSVDAMFRDHLPRYIAPIQQRLEVSEQRRAQLENELQVAKSIQALKGRYGDFDEKIIATELVKMTPQEQAQFDNPAGWELIYLRNKTGGQQVQAGGQAQQTQSGELRPGTPYAEGATRSTAAFPGGGQGKLPSVIDAASREAMTLLGSKMTVKRV